MCQQYGKESPLFAYSCVKACTRSIRLKYVLYIILKFKQNIWIFSSLHNSSYYAFLIFVSGIALLENSFRFLIFFLSVTMTTNDLAESNMLFYYNEFYFVWSYFIFSNIFICSFQECQFAKFQYLQYNLIYI